jgi:hypothetical protein
MFDRTIFRGNFSSIVTALSIAVLFVACGGKLEDPAVSVETEHSALTLQDGTWKWYQWGTDFNGPEPMCLDGTPTGFAVNYKSTGNQKLLVFLDGGGFCVDQASCKTTALGGTVLHTHYDGTNFQNEQLFAPSPCVPYFSVIDTNEDPNAASPHNWCPKPTSARGIFDRTSAANPFRDYNFVYIPYCTGDFHQGNRQDTASFIVPPRTPSNLYHVGFKNFGIFAGLIKGLFPSPPSITLTGISAGGFGTYYNYPQLRALYSPAIRMTTIDDGGVPFWTGNEGFIGRQGFWLRNYVPILTPSYEEDLFADAWGLDFTHPPAVLPVTRLTAQRSMYPQQNVFLFDVNTNPFDVFGVLSANNDWLVAPGLHLQPLGADPSIADGLVDFSVAMFGKPNVRTLYITSTSPPMAGSRPLNQHHTFIQDDAATWSSNGIQNWLATQFSL